jgi:type II secretory pathway component GspD/PulD (secretin)
MAGVACGQQASKELLRNLATPISARWGDAPARQALERLGSETKTPIWIDRRVDARKEVTLAATSRPIAVLIDDLTSSLDLGVAAIDSVVYVGPADSAGALPTLAKQWRRGASSALRKRSPLEWPRLSEPRKLADEIASSAGYRIENPAAIPHDLWPAGSTPPLAVGDQLTLLCLGFDLQWTIADKAKKTIRLEHIAARPPRKPATLASLVDSKPAPQGETRYTLRVVEQPIGPVLKQIATQLGLEIDAAIDADALDERVSFQVEQATLEELLTAAGDAANLDISATESSIRVQRLP